jgi:hypothetical protein
MRRQIDFFKEEHKTHSNKELFGLCDDDNDLPAYIDEDLGNKDSKWIALVNNDSHKEVDFYPIDHCIELKRPDGNDAQKCEGIVCYGDSYIIFTELKNKNSSWLSKAMDQIIETMSFFFNDYDSRSYRIKAWICNKQLTNQNYFQQINEFKDRTKTEFGKGYVLCIQKSINL